MTTIKYDFRKVGNRKNTDKLEYLTDKRKIIEKSTKKQHTPHSQTKDFCHYNIIKPMKKNSCVLIDCATSDLCCCGIKVLLKMITKP